MGTAVIPVIGDEEFSLFGAEIGPFKKVGAHYHSSGLEIYQIVEGSGIMHLGIPENNNNVTWTKSFTVTKGDCFTVNEGEVHQLINANDSKLLAIFGGKKSHLSTDRTLVKGYQE